MLDLHHVMRSLAQKRPLFHSEADFLHALAWEMHLSVEHEVEVRLERPMKELGPNCRVDLWVGLPAGTMIVEVKYPTARLHLTLGDEEFDLRDGAVDLTRYGFLKDLERCEKLAAVGYGAYALMLTNDAGHWKKPGPKSISAKFSLEDGHSLGPGCYRWAEGTGAGSIKGYENDLNLCGSYQLQWQDYATQAGRPTGEFRYLLIEAQPAREA